MSEAINFIDFILDKDLLSNKLACLTTLEEKKALANKWISTFLNDSVLGRVEPVLNKSLKFDTKGLPISLSFYKLNIRQQHLCKFVVILLDQACSSVREFEEWVPPNYQHMILTVAIALPNDIQEQEKDTENVPPSTYSTSLDSYGTIFSKKKEHERPDFWFRLWALRRSFKSFEADEKNGDLNWHFNTLSSSLQKPSNGPIGAMSIEQYCEFLEDLSEYSFKLDEHKAALHFSRICLCKKNEVVDKCSVDWNRIQAITKTCELIINCPKVFPVSQQFAHIKFSGFKDGSNTIESTIEYLINKTDLFDIVPTSLTQLIYLFQECWDLGQHSIASIYFLHWLTFKNIPTSEIEIKDLIQTLPALVLSWLRSKKGTYQSTEKLLDILIPNHSEDDLARTSRELVVDELIKILDISHPQKKFKGDEVSIEMSDRLQNSYAKALTSLQNYSSNDIFENELNESLKEEGLKNRKTEIHLFRGIQAYRQRRFEEARHLLMYIINEKPKQARLPSGDRDQSLSNISTTDLKEAHMCYSTAIQITGYAKIALYLEAFSSKFLLSPLEEDNLIPSKRNGLEPTPTDIERIIQYFYSRKNYNFVSNLLHKLCEVFLSSPPSETWLLSNFYAHLSHLFSQISIYFQSSIYDIDQNNFSLLLKTDFHALVSLRKDASVLINTFVSISDSRKIMSSIFKTFSAINSFEYMHVLAGLLYGLANRGNSHSHLYNFQGFGLFATILAHPNFIGDCDVRTIEIVKGLEKALPEPIKVGKEIIPELLQTLICSDMKPLSNLSSHLFCLFEACTLNNQHDLALGYFVEGVSIVSDDFSSISSLQKVFSKKTCFLAIHCVKQIGIPIMLANFCQIAENPNYTAVFKLLRETPASIVGEEYIPYLWDHNILEFLIAYVWKNNPRVQELLAAQINRQTKVPVQNTHSYEYLTQGFFSQLAKAYLSKK